MDFNAIVRAQVDIFSLGTDVNRTLCPLGSAVVSGTDARYYKNTFYPLERGFRYAPSDVAQLEAFYESRGRDGCLLDCVGQFAGHGFSTCAAIHVPYLGGVAVGSRDFACVRTFDIDAYCRVYVQADPNMELEPFKARTTNLVEHRDTRLFLLRSGNETIGAGSLVSVGDDVYMANGFSIRKEFRGGILSRARWIRLATESDVIGLTSTKFARALVRAIDGATIRGTCEFVRISSVRGQVAGQLSVAGTAPQTQAGENAAVMLG